LNGCDRRAEVRFPIRRDISKDAEAATIGNAFRSGPTKSRNDSDYFVCGCIKFPLLGWDCDFGYAQSIWRRREHRCAFDRFRDPLSHLSLEQRAVRILAFVSEDEPKANADVYKHENHERDTYADCHFAALL